MPLHVRRFCAFSMPHLFLKMTRRSWPSEFGSTRSNGESLFPTFVFWFFSNIPFQNRCFFTGCWWAIAEWLIHSGIKVWNDVYTKPNAEFLGFMKWPSKLGNTLRFLFRASPSYCLSLKIGGFPPILTTVLVNASIFWKIRKRSAISCSRNCTLLSPRLRKCTLSRPQWRQMPMQTRVNSKFNTFKVDESKKFWTPPYWSYFPVSNFKSEPGFKSNNNKNNPGSRYKPRSPTF